MNLCSFASLVRVEVLHEYLPAPPEAFSYRVQPAPSEKVGFLSSCKETLFLVFSGNFTFWIFAALPRATATVRCPPPFVAFSSKTEMNNIHWILLIPCNEIFTLLTPLILYRWSFILSSRRLTTPIKCLIGHKSLGSLLRAPTYRHPGDFDLALNIISQSRKKKLLYFEEKLIRMVEKEARASVFKSWFISLQLPPCHSGSYSWWYSCTSHLKVYL